MKPSPAILAHLRAGRIQYRDADDKRVLRRFSAGEIKIRDVTVDEEKGGGEKKKTRKVITMVASTDRACDFGGYREVLVHTDADISREAAHAILINHNPNRIAGPITAIRISNGQMEIDAELLPEARLESGVSVADAIESGALRGISVGYHYGDNDYTYDRSTSTITVLRWRLLEASLTPIPADDSAGLRSRSLPDHLTTTRGSAPTTKENTMKKFMKWLRARGYDFETLTEDQLKHLRALCDTDKEPADDYAKEARTIVVDDKKDEAGKAQSMKATRAIVERAEEYGLRASDYLELPAAEVSDAMLRDFAKKNKTETPGTPAVTVGRDAGDKLLTHARATFYEAGGIIAVGDEKKELQGIRSMSMRQLLREIARASGNQNAAFWSDMELAANASQYIDLRTFGRRDAPNKLVANFSNLLADVANKAVQAGLDQYDGATWNLWTSQRMVNNFLQVTNTNLAAGRLTLTAEGVSFPELKQRDGGYNSRLGLYGATISASFQAIVNDELAKILGDLRRIGAIAGLTIDREVYRVLLNATWTNDLSTGAGLATPANIDKPRAALKEKLSPAGERMGIVARYLLHDAVNANPAQVATGAIYGNGQTTTPSVGAKQIQTIESQWIGDTALLGGALATDYYLVGNPQLHDNVLVNLLNGVGLNPIIMPYDAGAVASEQFKVMLPFAATVATHTDSEDDARISSMQKATVA